MAGETEGRRVEVVRSWVPSLLRFVDLALPWLVGVLYVLVALDFRDGDPPVATVTAIVLAVVSGAALAWRRERPELVMAVVLIAGVPYHLLVPDLVIPFAGLVAVWTLTLTRPPRVSLVGLAGVLALSSVNFFTGKFDDAVFTLVVAVGVWALAEAARYRRTALQEAARRAVGDEQARIARELHDVIAHSVAVIVVQAGAAGDVFDTRPDQARAALRSIEDAGRDALRELRRLLGAVRPEVAADGAVAPQPGLERVDELAVPLRAAGLRVVVNREGPPADLPAGVDLSAYRIVQEALTNTLRHASATVAEVTFRYRADALEVEVVDDGRGAPGRSGAGSGFGLIGMRERAALLGGSLEAGPTAHGGYRVHARLPLDSAT
jgi:signal transduction histidine kinase